MKRGRMNIVIGGQAGSESKGKLSAWLCDKHKPDLLVMTSSPNAGHTAIMPDGMKKVSYHLPVGAVMCDCPIVLGPASLINVHILEQEIKDLGLDPARISLDPRASIITKYHIHREEDGHLSDIGSTLQGIGACRMGKMRRDGNQARAEHIKHALDSIGVRLAPASQRINTYLDKGQVVLCETTQGFDLDLEHGIDPVYCTSKMINPAMAMAEVGVSPSRVGDVYGVIRPYPIRVNNRTGTSGPYAEAPEITWGEVATRCGYPGDPSEFGEITTTTKLPRRVFEFSTLRFRSFIQVCRPTCLCLQFANYLDWRVLHAHREEQLTQPVLSFLNYLYDVGMVSVRFVGTGPGHNDMIHKEVP